MKIFRLNSTTDQLLERCRQQDKKAQHELYNRHASAMMGVCVRYVKNRSEAEEVLMNGFIKVFNKIEEFTGQGSFEGWMRKIMVNESLNFIRYRKNLFVETDEEMIAEPQHTPIESHETTKALLQMIDELPIGYRTVFNLFAIEGYGHGEIAKMLDIDENTSRSQLSRARKQLQERVTEAQYLYKP